MGNRREQRIRVSLPVEIWGMGMDGNVFSEKVHTVDITPVSLRLCGVTAHLQAGAIIGVQRGKRKARFRVTWVGGKDTARAGQLGAHLAEPGKHIWEIPLPRVMGDEGT